MDDLHVYHARGQATPATCARCQESILDTHHRIDDAIVCTSCYTEWEQGVGSGERVGEK
jgi:formylmethanofuran dehydrogenase subunit E